MMKAIKAIVLVILLGAIAWWLVVAAAVFLFSNPEDIAFIELVFKAAFAK